MAPGRQIGPFELVKRLGAGGMGEVWLARQVRPVKRQVALKLIKRGMDTERIVARFQAERQALALMDHPAVARVYEAGSTSTGTPYFVMEYVPGVALTAYCDEHKLSLDERRKLFLQVCEGVQHAHHKGVVHRDLKPSNVLVTIVDGKPRVKVIDFGVAKSMTERLVDHTLTELGTPLGTPAYMSPEQLHGLSQSVDTRSDVYSLGVMLYELLVGVLPVSPTADDAEYRLACDTEGFPSLLPQAPGATLESVRARYLKVTVAAAGEIPPAIDEIEVFGQPLDPAAACLVGAVDCVRAQP